MPSGSLALQTVPWQDAPEAHSLVAEQVVPHAFPLQTKGAQGVVTAALQVPAPSHVRAAAAEPAVAQVAATHNVPFAQRLQLPAPSQVPSRPHVEGRSWLHSSRGSEPEGTVEH